MTQHRTPTKRPGAPSPDTLSIPIHHASPHVSPRSTPLSSTQIRLYFAPIFIILNSPVTLWTIRLCFHHLLRFPAIYRHAVGRGILMLSYSSTHALVHFLGMVLCAWELLLVKGTQWHAEAKDEDDVSLGSSQRNAAPVMPPLFNATPIFPVSFLLGLYLVVSAWLWNTISWRCSAQFHPWFCVTVMSAVTLLHSALLVSTFVFSAYCLFVCCDVVLWGNETHWERFLWVCKLFGWSMYWKGREIGVRRGWVRRGAAGMVPLTLTGAHAHSAESGAWNSGALFGNERFIGGRARKRAH